ncbi:MAG TPA: transglycosylase domain-containing protein [Mycobacteriales bacterium]
MTKWALVGGLLTVIVGLVAISTIVYAAVRIPTPADLAQPEQVTLTYADGSPLGTIGQVNRISVPLSQVPVGVQHAVLAAEDRNYYHEAGISVRGIGRALVADVTAGHISQGGSTITQQYVKNAYLTQKRTFIRKIQEIALAVKISHQYSKDQILEDYLNTIYLGRGAYGIQAASEAYFGKPVGQLTVAEGAVIAGLIRAPSVLDPSVSPQAAKARWNQVLDTMVSQGWLTAAQRASTAYPPVLPPSSGSKDSGPTAYIDAAVKSFLVQQLGDARVALGGLTVTTTIDPTAQQAAAAAVAAKTRGAPATLTAGLESVDPRTGAIRAYYAGSDIARYPDSLATLKIPPGSSFKPIVLAQALGEGTPLSKTYDGSSPQTFAGTTVRNFDNEQFGQIDLTQALAASVNTVFVHLNLDTGPARVVALAHRLGIRETTKLDPNGTLALGQNYVHADDMAEVYATFANGGQQIAPYLVSKVVDGTGKVLYQADPKPTRVLATNDDANLVSAMQHVLQRGGTAASAALSGRPSAGKTGTTSGAVPNIAAWFDGFTPQLSTVVTLFNPNAQGAAQTIAPWSSCGCSEVTGGTVPAAIWHTYMTAALKGQPVLQFPAPTQTAPVVTTSTAPTSSSAPATSSSAPESSSSAPPSISVSLPLSPSATASGSNSASPSTSPSGKASSAAGPSANGTAAGRAPPAG